MKQITVISGKGGTGKTVITAAFASLAKSKVMADCDVDASDLPLLLDPRTNQTHRFKGGMTATVKQGKCTGCGECMEVCRFDAIREEEGQEARRRGQGARGQGTVVIDPVACEGCRVCAFICPAEAIQMKENGAGKWYVSETKYGPMVHARLGVAQENSGKLVAVVRTKAREIAQKNDLKLVMVDGPPGIGCPVIASITGVDLVVIITEPTFSAISDLKRVLGLTEHFRIPSVVLVNKHDINPDNTKNIEEFCQQEDAEVIGKLPFDNVFTEAMIEGENVIEHSDSPVVGEIETIWEKVRARMGS
jgi:MinD superfamily P-loop ATPase